MTKFYAHTTLGNGYQCGCCRHETDSYISEDSREAFIKEFFSEWHYSEGDIKLSYLKGITKEEIAELLESFKKFKELISQKESLKYKFNEAKKHVDAVEKYIQTVTLYPAESGHIDQQIQKLADLIGKDNIPEDLMEE